MHLKIHNELKTFFDVYIYYLEPHRENNRLVEFFSFYLIIFGHGKT